MKTLSEYIQERMNQDPEFRREYLAQLPGRAFREALIHARLIAGLTQEQLGALIGTSQSAIARMERGPSFPSVNTLHRLARALNVEFVIGWRVPIEVHLSLHQQKDDAGIESASKLLAQVPPQESNQRRRRVVNGQRKPTKNREIGRRKVV